MLAESSMFQEQRKAGGQGEEQGKEEFDEEEGDKEEGYAAADFGDDV